jgi:hypothetical protein
MWQKLHWRNRQTIEGKNQGTQAKLMRRSYGQTQISAVFFGRNHRIAWEEAKILNKRIQYIENIRKQPVCHVYKTPSADSALKFRPSGIL